MSFEKDLILRGFHRRVQNMDFTPISIEKESRGRTKETVKEMTRGRSEQRPRVGTETDRRTPGESKSRVPYPHDTEGSPSEDGATASDTIERVPTQSVVKRHEG